MSVRILAFLCIQALLAHAISAQLLGGALTRGLASGFNPAVNFGLAGSDFNLAGSGIGLAGSGIGLAGSGIGLAGSGIGLAGSGMNLAAPVGGGFTVTSSSPIVPCGVSVVTEYVIEGPVKTGGKVFSGTVRM